MCFSKPSPSIKEVNASLNVIYRSRLEAQPKPPPTINEFVLSTNDYPFTNNYYLGRKTTSDGSVALFFSSLVMLNAVGAVEEVNVATSYVVCSIFALIFLLFY